MPGFQPIIGHFFLWAFELLRKHFFSLFFCNMFQQLSNDRKFWIVDVIFENLSMNLKLKEERIVCGKKHHWYFTLVTFRRLNELSHCLKVFSGSFQKQTSIIFKSLIIHMFTARHKGNLKTLDRTFSTTMLA